MKRIAFAFAGLVLALLATSDVRAQSGLPAGVTDAMIAEGQQVFSGAGICTACHGPDGSGTIGPDLTDAEWMIGDGEYESIVAQILEGVSAADATNPLGAIMPPRGGAGITDAQVRAVAAYVWKLSR
jgi:mono/diheme cytochrome c family protein